MQTMAPIMASTTLSARVSEEEYLYINYIGDSRATAVIYSSVKIVRSIVTQQPPYKDYRRTGHVR
jgi:hypothetical protein